MTKKIFCFALSTMLLRLCFSAEAQQSTGKVPRVGFLVISSSSDSETVLRHDAFRQGLGYLGYVEGKNINIEYRYAEGKLERLPKLAAEIVRRNVDIIVAANATVARAVKRNDSHRNGCLWGSYKRRVGG
jgi:putative ABC transport system substrate-binding protein